VTDPSEVLTHLHQATVERLTAMTAELDAVTAAAAGANQDDEHDPEGSTLAFEREQLAALREQARHQVAEIEEAHDRLARGRYGVCERCGDPIAAERLDALPATRYCVRCAAR